MVSGGGSRICRRIGRQHADRVLPSDPFLEREVVRVNTIDLSLAVFCRYLGWSSGGYCHLTRDQDQDLGAGAAGDPVGSRTTRRQQNQGRVDHGRQTHQDSLVRCASNLKSCLIHPVRILVLWRRKYSWSINSIILHCMTFNI